MEKLSCLRCAGSWWPRSDGLPKCCPRCKSPYWNRARSRGGAAVGTSSKRAAVVAEDGPRYVAAETYTVEPDY